jgi:glycosidase
MGSLSYKIIPLMKLKYPLISLVIVIALFMNLMFINPVLAAQNNAASIYDLREQDWRNGALVYQVLVDRFAPAADLQAKSHLYESPKKLHDWGDTPKRGVYLDKAGLWSHEIDFWGGDLNSLRGKLDYLNYLDVDVLYLNPIHVGFTNHKYDSMDFEKVSPEFGSRQDVISLANDLHGRGMRLVLDGVFNHMSRFSERFLQAANDPKSKYRNWFYFGPQYPKGVRLWAQAESLPELNLENRDVQKHIWAGRHSVVQQYLKDGIDGWRLDVAYDIGYEFLDEITQAAHRAKPGSLVVGEIWSYPAGWFPSLDGVMNFTARKIIWRLSLGDLDAKVAGEMLDRMIADAGIENMLKSWMVLDNHDTPRLKNMLPETWQQQMAQLLQFTLPGSPNLYYGTELGMTGGDDPEMRAPMRWDLVNENTESLAWMKKLIELRKQHRALRVGDFSLLTTTNLLAFERYTNKVEDTVVVIINPSNESVTESVMIANSSLMNWTHMKFLMGATGQTILHKSSLLYVTVPAHSFMVLKPDVTAKGGYTPYKRIP